MKAAGTFRGGLTNSPSPELTYEGRLPGESLLSDLLEAHGVVFGVQLHSPPDPVAERPLLALVCNPFAQEEHGVHLAPVLAVLPNLHGRAAHPLRKLDEARVAHVAAVAEQYLVVDRHQLILEAVESGVHA